MSMRVTVNAHLNPIDTSGLPAITPPPPSAFGERDFMDAPELERLAAALLEHTPELAFPSMFQIVYAWKREASVSGGRITLGKCIKTSGPLRMYSGADVVIWLAADYFQDQSGRTIVAALYHELLHVTFDDKTGLPKIRHHDAEVFVNEIERFGLWRLELQHIAAAVTQLELGITGER